MALSGYAEKLANGLAVFFPEPEWVTIYDVDGAELVSGPPGEPIRADRDGTIGHYVVRFVGGKTQLISATNRLSVARPCVIKITATTETGVTYTNLSELRLAAGIDTTQLAVRLKAELPSNYSSSPIIALDVRRLRAAVEQIESNRNLNWPWPVWEGLAAALDVTLEELLGAPAESFDSKYELSGPLIVRPL